MLGSTSRNAENRRFIASLEVDIMFNETQTTRNTIELVFGKLVKCCALSAKMNQYNDSDWMQLVSCWLDIFSCVKPEQIYYAACRYIKEGGKYFPFPGEIASLLPANEYIDSDALKRLDYQTIQQKKDADKAFDDARMLKPYGG